MKTNNHFAAYSAAAMRISASFLLLLGILFAGCRENKPENPTDPAAPAGTVTITGEIKVGSQLTASSDGNLTGAFTWESAESATAPDSDWNLISGSTDTADKSVLTLTTAQKDKFVRAKRGDVKSISVGPIEDSTPARTITIEGKTVVGETLKAKDSDTTASGDFVWASAASETAPDSEWKLISPGGTGTDKSELTLAAAQKDQWIRATRGTVVSAPVGKVTEAAQTQGGDDTASGGDDVTPDTYSAAGLDKII